MTSAQFAKRLEILEKIVARLEAKMARPADPHRACWREDAGRFKDDPVFEEILRLGRAYRESLKSRDLRKRFKVSDSC